MKHSVGNLKNLVLYELLFTKSFSKDHFSLDVHCTWFYVLKDRYTFDIWFSVEKVHIKLKWDYFKLVNFRSKLHNYKKNLFAEMPG